MDVVWHTKGPLRTPGGMTFLGEFGGMATYMSRHGWCREVLTHYLSNLGISSDCRGWVDILNTNRQRSSMPRGCGHTTTWIRDIFNMYTNTVRTVLDSNLAHLDRRKFAGKWGTCFHPGSRIPHFRVSPVQTHDDPQIMLNMAWKLPPAYRRDNPHLFTAGLPGFTQQKYGHLFGVPIDWLASIPIMSSLVYFPRLWEDMLVDKHPPVMTMRHFKPKPPDPSLGNLWWRLLATLGTTAQFSKQGSFGLWILIGLYCLMLETSEQRDQYISLLYEGRGRIDGMNSWAARLHRQRGQEGLPKPLCDLYAKLYDSSYYRRGVGNLMRPVSYLY